MKPSGNPDWNLNKVVTPAKLTAIEDALKALEIVGALPAAGLAGRMVRLSTDDHLYVDNGIAWLKVGNAADLTAANVSYAGSTNLVAANVEAALDELDVEKVGRGTANTAIEQVFAVILPVDTRSLVATAWNADSKPTALEFRNGAAVLVTVSITYNGDGKATQVQAVGDGKTITYTLSWTGEQFNSYTKVVI